MLGRFLNLVCLLYFDSIKFAGLGNLVSSFAVAKPLLRASDIFPILANFTDLMESYFYLSSLRAKKRHFPFALLLLRQSELQRVRVTLTMSTPMGT